MLYFTNYYFINNNLVTIYNTIFGTIFKTVPKKLQVNNTFRAFYAVIYFL